MVFPDGYKFYDPVPNKPKPEDSEKPLIGSESEKDAQKVRITETPAPAYEEEPPLSKLTLTRSRTKELGLAKKPVKPRPLDRFFDLVSRQSVFVKGLLVLFVTGIPFAIVAIVAHSIRRVDIHIWDFDVTFDIFSIWLLTRWASFMGLLYLGITLSAVASRFCAMSNILEKYRGLARAICTRIVLLFWALVLWIQVNHLDFGPNGEKGRKAYNTLNSFFKFLVLAFAIIIVQGVVLQLIKIQYISGFIGPRAAKAEHELQVLKELDHLIRPPRRLGDISTIGWAIKWLVAPVERTDYYVISRGIGDEDRWDRYAEKLWDKIAGTKESLTYLDLCNQMDRIGRSQDKERARGLFDELDNSTDGQVTESEVKELVHRIGLQLNRRTQAVEGIKHLSSKLEVFLSVITLLLVVFVYTTVFDEKLGEQLKSLWGGLVALSFAMGGSVAEFVNAMVFCFGKHPYDIGDFVEIKTNKYVVTRIYLTHTQFEQVQNEHVRGLFCQMSHASLQTEPITNWTRTVDDAVTRHTDSAKAKDDKTSGREDEIAHLVTAKLNYFQQTQLAKTTSS